MKKHIYQLLILLLPIITFISCEKNEEIDTKETIEKISGNWTVQENSTVFGNSNYAVEILKKPDSENQVEIRNFYHLSFTISTIATIDGLNINIPEQIVSGQTVKGSGKINSNLNRINIDFTADDGSGDLDIVNLVMSK